MQATNRRLFGGSSRAAVKFTKHNYGPSRNALPGQPARSPTKAVRVKSPSPILDLLWEKDPGPINCLTYSGTTNLMDAAHPLRLRMQKKLLQFDTSKLHFACVVPASLHKKPTIRHRVKRRFKHSFLEDLKASGWDEEGNPLPLFANENLNGALCLKINGEDPWAAREVEWVEIKSLTRWALDNFLQGRSRISDNEVPRDGQLVKGFVLDDKATPPELRRSNRTLAAMTPEEAREKFGNPAGLPFPVWRLQGSKDYKVTSAAMQAFRENRKHNPESLDYSTELEKEAIRALEAPPDEDELAMYEDPPQLYPGTFERKPKNHRDQKILQSRKVQAREENSKILKSYDTEERRQLYQELQKKSKEQMQAYEKAKRALHEAKHSPRNAVAGSKDTKQRA